MTDNNRETPLELSSKYLEQEASDETPQSEAAEGASEPVKPVTVTDILAYWNDRFPGDEDQVLDLTGINELVHKEEFSDEEFKLVQTLIAFMVDSAQHGAGLIVLSEVAKGLISKGKKVAVKNLRSGKHKDRVIDDAKTSLTVLNALTVDITKYNIDCLEVLNNFNETGLDTDGLTELIQSVEENVDKEDAKYNVED